MALRTGRHPTSLSLSFFTCETHRTRHLLPPGAVSLMSGTACDVLRAWHAVGTPVTHQSPPRLEMPQEEGPGSSLLLPHRRSPRFWHSSKTANICWPNNQDFMFSGLQLAVHPIFAKSVSRILIYLVFSLSGCAYPLQERTENMHSRSHQHVLTTNCGKPFLKWNYRFPWSPVHSKMDSRFLCFQEHKEASYW